MQTVALEIIGKIAELAASGLAPDEYEAATLQIVGEPDLARRVIDWLPEAFGMVLVSHMGAVTLPTTFMAQNSSGSWVEVPFSKDPVFGNALKLAQSMYHHGPREVFSALALRSSAVDAVNRTLNAGDSIDGAVLSPPTMLGIAAETYGGAA
ncbi:hypothetical protein [Lysobacter sp. M15]|uniref:hypothetical protein n=1 Tax=Lysobacter sp. M15 TaxID=2916837 RepID=UPI001F57818F|nr:hypothetical protein [Lysobacter sp. M15]